MRVSFVNPSLRKSSDKIDSIKLQNQKCSDLKRNFVNDERYLNKLGKKQDGSFSVSFNLDQMYFESDTSTQQNIKKKLEKSRGQIIEEIQVNNLRQQHPLEQRSNHRDIEENLPANNYFVKKQVSNQVFIKKEPNEQKIQIPESTTRYQEKYQDKQIQVDFPQIEYNQDDSVQQLSEIDMLFIFPQNITKYNETHPLYVTVSDLAKIYPLNLQLRNFVQLDPQFQQDKNRKVFEAFMIDWAKSEERLSKKVLTLAKMRTIIIRDAMNNLVDQLVPPIQTEDYHFRISKTYRSRYIKAGVPIPPPRVNNSYLQGLFSRPQIKKYYQNYVQQKLQIFLKQQNYRKIEIYTLDLIQCLRLYQDKNVQELVQIIQRKKKPFTNKQIELIIEQAIKIGNEYGKDAKRIGNGVRNSKMSRNSQKILQKINIKNNLQSTSKISVKIQNQDQQDEFDQDIEKIDDKCKKKVKLQPLNQQVKLEVKIEEITPNHSRKNINLQPPKIIQKVFNRSSQQK